MLCSLSSFLVSFYIRYHLPSVFYLGINYLLSLLGIIITYIFCYKICHHTGKVDLLLHWISKNSYDLYLFHAPYKILSYIRLENISRLRAF